METNIFFYFRNVWLILLFFSGEFHILMAQTFIVEPFRLCNTPYDEHAPIISPDERFLFYTIAKHPQNVGGIIDMGDIWYSTWNDGVWSAPIHGGTVLNNEGYNAVLGFSADGNKIFLA